MYAPGSLHEFPLIICFGICLLLQTFHYLPCSVTKFRNSSYINYFKFILHSALDKVKTKATVNHVDQKFQKRQLKFIYCGRRISQFKIVNSLGYFLVENESLKGGHKLLYCEKLVLDFSVEIFVYFPPKFYFGSLACESRV